MTVFDVLLNGRKICRAGIGDNGVLTALVSWAPAYTGTARSKRGRARNATQLRVGGLANDTHHSWIGRRLKAGDRVTVSVLNADSFDRPAAIEVFDPARRQKQERRYYERLKSQYEPAQARTVFLNVDLDIWSKAPLERLAHALGGEILVLRNGKEHGRYAAHLEHARSGSGTDVDRAIRRLVRIVEQLPRDDRKLWDRAERREFNVGIQSGMEPHASEFRVGPGTLEAIARVNGRLTLTVYGAATA